MNLRRKIAVTFSALAMTIGGGILTATPAAADEPCSSGKLCLYRSTLFRTMELSTGSVSHCYALDTYNLTDPWAGIMSYRNNLPVKATIWWFHGNNYFYPGNWSAYATIAPGGSSSDTTAGHWVFNDGDLVCTGDDKPWL
ncbi:peptidase inhibitor [Streptomyces uncialis]|uniref:peptidase inhibitor n=1 Tax=Streptomyces uncialis TaxID=1048205 RepID=UPI002F913380|nr:peptidase inhibitor [Streptomyces uncialis]